MESVLLQFLWTSPAALAVSVVLVIAVSVYFILSSLKREENRPRASHRQVRTIILSVLHQFSLLLTLIASRRVVVVWRMCRSPGTL